MGAPKQDDANSEGDDEYRFIIGRQDVAIMSIGSKEQSDGATASRCITGYRHRVRIVPFDYTRTNADANSPMPAINSFLGRVFWGSPTEKTHGVLAVFGNFLGVALLGMKRSFAERTARCLMKWPACQKHHRHGTLVPK